MQSRDDQTGDCLGFARACLSEFDFAKLNPEGRSGQFRFNSRFSSDLAMSSAFDLSLLQTKIKGDLDLQILTCQVLVCNMKTSAGSALGETEYIILALAFSH